MRKLAIVAFVVAFVFEGCLCGLPSKGKKEKEYKTVHISKGFFTGKEALTPVHESADPNSRKLCTLKGGTKVKLIQKDVGIWAEIAAKDCRGFVWETSIDELRKENGFEIVVPFDREAGLLDTPRFFEVACADDTKEFWGDDFVCSVRFRDGPDFPEAKIDCELPEGTEFKVIGEYVVPALAGDAHIFLAETDECSGYLLDDYALMNEIEVEPETEEGSDDE